LVEEEEEEEEKAIAMGIAEAAATTAEVVATDLSKSDYPENVRAFEFCYCS
jgi:hypothetical protein